MKHNLFSPSSAHIWRYCLQSKLLTQGIEQKETDSIKRGQYLHYLFNRLIKNGYIDTLHNSHGYEPTQKDIEFIYEAYSEIKKNYKGSKEKYLEKFFPLEFCKEKIGGTIDLAFIKNNMLHVYDLKMGRVKVNAYQNEQLILYATSIIKYLENLDIDIKDIKLGILQPTIRHYDEWLFSIEHLESEFLPIVEKIANQDYGFYSGDHCQYCPSKTKCPLVKKGLQIISSNNPIEAMTDARKTFILSLRKPIQRLMTEIENEFIKRLLSGESIDRVTINTITERNIIDDTYESELKNHLGDDIYSPKTILSYAKIRDKLTDVIVEKERCKKSEAKKEAIELLKPYLKKKEVTKYRIEIKYY